MSQQQYRGYLIDVLSTCANDACSYHITIVRSSTGQLMHKESSSPLAGFADPLAAEDCAFQNARAWTELHPTYFRWHS